MDSNKLQITGHIHVEDADTNEVIRDTFNAIHYENFSEALANAMANKGIGHIYQMSFGNGGSSVDPSGIIAYLPPNTVGQNANLYNETFSKVVDDTDTANTDPSRNNLVVAHTIGKVYTDIVVTCLLDYGEPAGQQAFDNSTDLDGEFVFDEMGLKVWNGGVNDLKLVTHAIFHPVQKALNRRFKITYTVRIQSLTSLSSNA